MKITLAIRNAIILASIGIVMTILVGYVEFKMQSTFERHAPYIKLTDYLKNSVTQSQLRLEQAIDGSTDVDYQKDVVTGLTSSKKMLQSMMDGQETELGKFSAPDDEETIAILKKSIIELENLMALAVNFPDVIKYDDNAISEEEWKDVLLTFNQAVTNFTTFRIDEGNVFCRR